MRRAIVLCTAAVLVALTLGAAPTKTARVQIPLEAAKIIIEFNATDEDVGIQVFLDGEPWKSVNIVGPDKRRIARIDGTGNLGKLGLTELFFESNEPSLVEDMTLAEFLALFPEGEYKFSGRSVEGDELVASATFTHNIPDGPSIVLPLEGETVDPDNAIIQWDLVTSPPGIEIAGYQVIVEQVDPVTTDAISVLDVNKLPASATQFKVPPEFLKPGTEYLFEVLAIEVGGNQTISQSSFVTE